MGATYRSTEARNASRRANYAQTAKNGPRRPWEQYEDRAIMSRVFGPQSCLTDRELSGLLTRSVQAIQIRRSRIQP